MWMPRNGVEWASPTDLAIAAQLGPIFRKWNSRDEDSLRVLEVGVWKGAWSQTVLMNESRAEVCGIDPYPFPGGPAVRQGLETTMAKLGIASRFQLMSSWESLAAPGAFDAIHIDGLHTEEAVQQDLLNSLGVMKPSSLIIIDDYRNTWYPGIAAAMWNFCRDYELRVVATTPAKAYLSPLANAGPISQSLEESLSVIRGLQVHRNQEHLDPGLLDVQRPTALGFPVLRIESLPFWEARASVKHLAKAITPPLLWETARRKRLDNC